MTFLFGDLTASLADKLGRFVPPILRLRESESYQATAFAPGTTVVFDDVFATVIYDDGGTAKIESIKGECFAFETSWDWAYTTTLEVDSKELQIQNPDKPKMRIVPRPMTDSLHDRLMDPDTPHAPPGALPGYARRLR
jgi:hypothetical protein